MNTGDDVDDVLSYVLQQIKPYIAETKTHIMHI